MADEPITRFDFDRYVFEWPSMGVALSFNGFYEDRERNLHAELAVYDFPVNGKGPAYLMRGRHNLSAPLTQGKIAKELSTLGRDLTAPAWNKLLRQACFSSLDKYFAGEPAVDAMTVPKRVEHLLVSPLFPYGQVSMVFADGDSGKSLLATLVGIAMQHKLELPHPLSCTRQTNMLYLDWESDGTDYRDRVEWIARGYQPENLPDSLSPMQYMSMSRRLLDDLPRVRREIERTEAGFLVVDSIAAACGGYELKESESAIRTLTALRLLSPVTTVVLAHTSKENAAKEAGKATAYGSAFFRNYVRRNWELRSYKNIKQGWLRMGLYMDKANWRPGLVSEFGIAFTFNNEAESATAKYLDVQADPFLSNYGATANQVSHILQDGKGRTVDEIAKATSLGPRAVAKAIERREDMFVNLNPGKGKTGLYVLKAVDE